MMVINITKNAVMVRKLHVAHNIFERLRGLIGSEPLRTGDGFLIPHCKGVHTFGMGYPIDVIYLDGDGKVDALRPNLEPNVVGKVDLHADSVLELPAGTIDKTHTAVGDVFFVNGSDRGSEPVFSRAFRFHGLFA